ncbi:MAG: zinc-ribbon domain containing protein [Chloroflexi bacterium]|nr:zinc-ribbon domain containing protein [Chloroflexota bacterium]
MSYADKVLTCRDCGCEFSFTAGEQEFYAARGLQNEPGRCPSCRASRRSQRSTGGYSSGYSSRPSREMHEAVCAECGAQTRVPFVPRNDKPVYCSPCYDKVRGR